MAKRNVSARLNKLVRKARTVEMLKRMEDEAQKPAHVVLLDFGRKAGVLDKNGRILCTWKVEPYKEDKR